VRGRQAGRGARHETSRIDAALRGRLENVLSVLEAATHPLDLDLPGYRLHQLKGELKGVWSVTVSGNWRNTFQFEGGNAYGPVMK